MKKGKRIVSLILAIALVISMIPIWPAGLVKAENAYPTGNEMFHVTVGATADQYLGQKVTLTNGKTYNLSFKMKIVSGQLEGKSTDNIQVTVRDYKSSGGYETERFSSKGTGDKAMTVSVDASTYEYSCSFTYNVDTTTITNYTTYKTWVGIIATKASDVEYYVTDFKLVEDGTDTNKMSGIDNFHSNPSNWTICKWATAPTTSAANPGTTNYADINEKYPDNKVKKLTINSHTIRILDKGETFVPSEPDIDEPIGETYPTGNEMLHVQVGTFADQYLGQKVTLTQGKTYNLSFKIKIVSGQLEGKNTDNIQVTVRDYKSTGGYETSRFSSMTSGINATLIDAEAGTYEYSCSFTYNVDTATITNYATYKTWVGIIATKASGVEYYVTDFKLVEDGTDTNKMSGIDNFREIPSNWTICKWATAPTTAATNPGTTNYADINERYSDNKVKKLTINTHTIEILAKNDTFIAGNPYPAGNEMFHVIGGKSYEQYLGQKVALEQGKTYNLSFKMRIVKGTFKGTSNDNIQVTVRDYTSSGGYQTERFSSKGTGAMAMPIKVKAGTYEYSCSFTYNVDTTTINNYSTYKTWVGIIVAQNTEVEYYVTDFVLTEDGTDTNKMSGIADFHAISSNWTICKWATAPTNDNGGQEKINYAVINERYSDNKVKKLTINTHTIEVMDKGETFVPIEAYLSGQGMICVDTIIVDGKTNTTLLGQQVNLEKDTTYEFRVKMYKVEGQLPEIQVWTYENNSVANAIHKTINLATSETMKCIVQRINQNASEYVCIFTYTGESADCYVGLYSSKTSAMKFYATDFSLTKQDRETNLMDDFSTFSATSQNGTKWRIGTYTNQCPGGNYNNLEEQQYYATGDLQSLVFGGNKTFSVLSKDDYFANAPYYDIYSTETDGRKLEETDTKGVYTVVGDYAAYAVNREDPTIKLFSKNGTLSFVGINSGSYDVVYYAYGDANQDAQINVRDLVRVKKLIYNESYKPQADIDTNGSVTNDDLRMYREQLVGKKDYGLNNLPKAIITSGNFNQVGGAEKATNDLKNSIKTYNTVSTNGTVYYVSSSAKFEGESDGTEEKPFKSIAEVNEKLSDLNQSDKATFLFKRGDVFRTTTALQLRDNTIYSAYGDGEKPQILGSIKNYASGSEWEETNTTNVWVSTKAIGAAYDEGSYKGAIGNVVFNNGEFSATRKMNGTAELLNDGDYYYDTTTQKVYLYSTSYNPGHYFDSIEVHGSRYLAVLPYQENHITSNLTINNLCFKYAASHGISIANEVYNMQISGCEIGWIGGNASGTTRLGNAIETFRGVQSSTVQYNYIYQAYDAGITFQGVCYEWDDFALDSYSINNNVIEYCGFALETWISPEKGEWTNFHRASVKDVAIDSNIIRFNGCGFQKSRSDKYSMAAFQTMYNDASGIEVTDFTLTNNTFDCENSYYFHDSGTDRVDMFDKFTAVSGNKFYQKAGSSFAVVRPVPTSLGGNGELGIAPKDVEELQTMLENFAGQDASFTWVSGTY